MSRSNSSRIRIAAISFLNPAPLMWDFEHPPLAEELANRYQLDWMLPSECADRLATGQAELGLIPIAALARHPQLGILPGCTIASKKRVRSLLLVHRASQSLRDLRSVAADTASRTTVTYARILFHKWGNPTVPFLPMRADLDTMLEQADAAVVIGDPALMLLEEQVNRRERTGEELVYHDLAEEWTTLSGLPFVSAVWATAPGLASDPQLIADVLASRDHGLRQIDALAEEWSRRVNLSAAGIASYLTANIHYTLDEECLEGMKLFYREAAATGALPHYDFEPPQM